MSVSVVVVGGPLDWIPPSAHLPVLSRHDVRAASPPAGAGAFEYSVQRWSLHGKQLPEPGPAGLAGALPTAGQLFVVVPARAVGDLDRRGRRDALEVAEALTASRGTFKKGVRVALVVDGDLARDDCLEWASLLGARRRVSKEAAAALFFSRSMIRAPVAKEETRAHKLWEGKLIVPGCSPDATPCGGQTQKTADQSIPGFRLSIVASARKRSEHRILDLLPVSAKRQISPPAFCLTEVPPSFAIGGLVGARNELELEIVDGCNGSTGFFCKDWVDRGVCLLVRLEKLNLLCFPRIPRSDDACGWIWDVAPVYDLSTPVVDALAAAWFRKYELGTCGRSKVNFPCPGLTSLPVVRISQSADGQVSSTQEDPGTTWITRSSFDDAVSILDRAKAKASNPKLPPKGSSTPQTRPSSTLREPPSYDEIVTVERNLLKRKDVARTETARKRARVGGLSRDNLGTDLPPPAWTGRSSLSEDFNISTGGGGSSKDQIAAFRQSRQARLQSMQAARNRASRQGKDRPRKRSSYRTSGSGRAGSFDFQRSVTPGVGRSRARSLGVSEWQSLAVRVQDTTILPRLEGLPNFFEYGDVWGWRMGESEFEAMQFHGDRVGLVKDESETAPGKDFNRRGHGVEYAPRSDCVRDALLTKYTNEAGRSAQEFSSVWGTLDEKGIMQKLDAGGRALVDLRDAQLKDLRDSQLKDFSDSQRKATQQSLAVAKPSPPALVDDPANDGLIAIWGRGRSYQSIADECATEDEEAVMSVPSSHPSVAPEPVVERKLELDDGKAGLRALLASLERQRMEVDAEISRVRRELALETEAQPI